MANEGDGGTDEPSSGAPVRVLVRALERVLEQRYELLRRLDEATGPEDGKRASLEPRLAVLDQQHRDLLAQIEAISPPESAPGDGIR